MRKQTWILFLIFLLIAAPVAATQPWPNKPPLGSVIDWSHPSTKGLVACWLMNEKGSNRIQNLASPKYNGTFGVAATTPSWYGHAISFDGGDGINFGDNDILDGATELTAMIVFSRPANSAATQNICRKDGSFTPFQFYPSNKFGGAVWIGAGGTTYRARTQTTYAIPNNVINKYFFVWGSNYNGGYPRLFINGVYAVNDAYNETKSGAITNTTYAMTFGAKEGMTAEFFTGKMYLVYYWRRALTTQELHQLTENPYAFIKSPSWTIWGALGQAVADVFSGRGIGRGVGRGIFR